ncbi:MAG: crossover junction endodeoxyribonuclease RuvC [Phycisphaeraceae bacterium]|nr:MAG: crossover junction endodeoxyribonuclease RuvC [Phycisphaeraceae bacterium]
MRVVGIDPGLRITGYACVHGDPWRPSITEAGVFRLDKVAKTADSAESVSARLVELERDIAELIGRTKPDLVAVEAMFSNPKHPATVIKMAHGRGVVLLAIRKAGVPLLELRPAEVKKSLTGSGQATKEQMQLSVQRFFKLPEPPKPADVADALAIAVTGMQRSATLNA